MSDDDPEVEQLARLIAADDVEEVERGYRGALARMAGSPRMQRLAAVAYDRVRALRGREQKFGTCGVLRGGVPQLWPVEDRTTDSERAKWGLPSLQVLRTECSTAPRVDKGALRAHLRARRANFAAERSGVVAELTDSIAAHGIEALAPRLGASDIVAAYWPVRGEADPRALARRLAQACGVGLALPVVLDQHGAMEFRSWSDDADLVPAGFGTRGPGEGAEVVVPTVVLTPLVGFDATGARLGQGGGYYDRWLSAPGAPLAVGVAWSLQQLPVVPTTAEDRTLAGLVTERGAQWFAS